MLTLYGHESSTENSTTSTADASDRRDETPPSETVVRDIHAMTTTSELTRPQQRGGGGYLSPSRSIAFSDGTTSSGENFTTVSREFNALVIAGSSMDNNSNGSNQSGGHRDVIRDERNELTRIGENDDVGDHGQVPEEDSNPWAIVPDGYNNRDGSEDNNIVLASSSGQNRMVTTASVQRVKREEVEAKITAWQTAKVAKINNKFKRQDAVINGWLNEQVHKANSWMKKIERKLEDRRAKAMEKTQNKVAKAQRKAEERRATAEGKRGTEVARVLEVANLMRAIGRPPAKRSFFAFS
ncbi:Remorin C-terminal [Arabidopsis suecica]|uniref:Remorin C-terminal n=1 Tax=Arabidopsis suecica TaxID=45249 RepID=A0A8T2A331_ARASU|nr:Remorin C-terminal [Arabidopsis suecica]